MAHEGKKFTELHRARLSVSHRENALKRMRARHAAETADKEQALIAARARLRLAEQDNE